MQDILLTTLNARYSHCALGLRYLIANSGDLQSRLAIVEFTLETRAAEVVEQLLDRAPLIIGFGVYIWNVESTYQIVALLKQVRPDIKIILGGPEVSFELEDQPIVALADHVITGPADLTFADVCRRILAGESSLPRVIAAEQAPVAQLRFPYAYYTATDIAQRVLYVEASRGCPFKCEFCLSALDKTAWPFDLDAFLQEMTQLFERGARQFKFVDRTFNLNIKASIRILEFFLARVSEGVFAHFEVIPDHLPDALKEVIAKFPPGTLQFEIGVQTFDPFVQGLISRKQNNDKTAANLRWLREHSNVHVHADLIVGLPGEDMASFARGFDQLVALDPQEIQVGILKRLRGTPIARHTEVFAMRYNPQPPYNVLATDRLNYKELQRLTRFARYWDVIANSGRFKNARTLLLQQAPFERFMALSDWLYQTTSQTYKLALPRLFELLYQWMTQHGGVFDADATEALWQDYQVSGLKGWPSFVSVERAKQQRLRSAEANADPATLTRQSRHVVL